MAFELKKHPITIVGAGPVGCFLAILLAKRGYKVNIYERHSAMQNKQMAAKRSFNVTFFYRGVKALQYADLWKLVQPVIIPLQGSVSHPNFTQEVFTKYGGAGKPYVTARRSDLLAILTHKASTNPNIHIHYNMRIISIDKQRKLMFAQNMKTKRSKSIACDVIIGTDGVNSLVRTTLQEGQETMHRQEYLDWGYKQIYISPKLAKTLKLRKNVMHVWSRETAFISVFPNADGSYAAMIILPQGLLDAFKQVNDRKILHAFLHKTFPNLRPAFSEIVTSIEKNPDGRFVSVFTAPWYYKNFLAIAGDAAHAMHPFYGQGMSAGFEDCITLVQLLDKQGPDWAKIFPLYEEARKKHVDILVELSRQNFLSLRADKWQNTHAMYNKIDMILHSLLPYKWLPPMHTLVANTDEPYGDLYEKHQKQRRMLHYAGVGLMLTAVSNAAGIVFKRKNKHTLL